MKRHMTIADFALTVGLFGCAVIIALFGATGCGVQVHHQVDPIQGHVDGTIYVSIPTVAYMPYLMKVCQSGGEGMLCYNADPTMCATCLMAGLASTVSAPATLPVNTN